MGRHRFLSGTAVLFLFSLLSVAGAQDTPPRKIELNSVQIDHYRFNTVNKEAQMWSALYIASNGKIYVGLCTHADAATVYDFDPRTETMRYLANITEIAGERGKGIWTTGKIHVQMQELDGYVYFGTLDEDNGPPVIDAASYQGPHWYRIEMRTGKVEQLGLINSFWGLLGQAMDKKRRLIFGLAENGHLYKYFIDQDRTLDLGRVDDWDICRTVFMDDLGNVYGSYPPGRIWKYDAAQERVFDLDWLRLPILNQSRSMANPMLDRKAQWRIIEWDPVDKAGYGIVGGSNILFRYDVHDGLEGKITPLAQMCAPQFREGDSMNIPYATLAMTLSQKERKVYYVADISGDFDYGAVQLNVRDQSKLSKSFSERAIPPLSYFISYDLRTGKREDIGLLRTADGRYGYGMEGAKTDADGKIWFVGAFEEPDSRLAAREMEGKFPYSMGLGCYNPFSQK